MRLLEPLYSSSETKACYFHSNMVAGHVIALSSLRHDAQKTSIVLNVCLLIKQ